MHAPPDIDATFLQPFLSYTTTDAWTFTLNTESTYDWESEPAGREHDEILSGNAFEVRIGSNSAVEAGRQRVRFTPMSGSLSAK